MKILKGHLVLVNQMVYNDAVLTEVENDNIRYDKRTL